MEYIRHQRTLPEHDPGTRHCLYGLDADLIMLGLATHEPNFSLLREEIKFTTTERKGRNSRPEEITFHLLHLSVMRDYIHHEFAPLRESLAKMTPDQEEIIYDLERVIDDWVMMGFLVGNDFVPHLPHMHIRQDHLPLIYSTYSQAVPEMGGYLTDRGHINMKRFEIFLATLAAVERETFENSMADARFMKGKRGQMMEKYGTSTLSSTDIREKREKGKSFTPSAVKKFYEMEQIAKTQENEGVFDGDMEQGEIVSIDSREIGTDMGVWDDEAKKEFVDYRNQYYHGKFGKKLTDDFQFIVKTEWVRAIQWIMHYYYNGVQSWGWYYPFHYSPFLSDMVKLEEVNLKYDLGKPFLPFEQLLAVLPAGSKSALPLIFHPLMESDTSPIIDFYPTDFETDLNGKTQEWEAVVLISFIDEDRLRDAMRPLFENLSKAEKVKKL